MLYRIHEYDNADGWRIVMQYDTKPDLATADSLSLWAFNHIAENGLEHIRMGHTMWDIVSPTTHREGVL